MLCYNRYFFISKICFIKKVFFLLFSIIISSFSKILVIFFGKKANRNLKYYLSICAIFKNEAQYLKEWIEYHRIVGVDHFYLYNNFSNDDYIEVLEKYIEKGIVTLIDWPVKQGQISAYENFFNMYTNQTSWVAFIDIDEFIVPKYEDSLKQWLVKYEKYPSVIIYWKVFGTSGFLKADPKKLVTERFTVCWNKYHTASKTIFNTSYKVSNITNHHSYHGKFKKIDIPPINEWGKMISFNFTRFGKKESEIQINHYWSKSFEEFQKKQDKGDVFYSTSPINLDYFYFHESKNTDSDYTIFRFLLKLKLALGLNQ